MKRKIKFSIDEQIESFSHMKFTALIMIDNRVVIMDSICFDKLDYAAEKSIELMKNKFNNMYQDMLSYREKYKLDYMTVGLDFATTHYVDNLPV